LPQYSCVIDVYHIYVQVANWFAKQYSCHTFAAMLGLTVIGELDIQMTNYQYYPISFLFCLSRVAVY